MQKRGRTEIKKRDYTRTSQDFSASKNEVWLETINAIENLYTLNFFDTPISMMNLISKVYFKFFVGITIQIIGLILA